MQPRRPLTATTQTMPMSLMRLTRAACLHYLQAPPEGTTITLRCHLTITGPYRGPGQMEATQELLRLLATACPGRPMATVMGDRHPRRPATGPMTGAAATIIDLPRIFRQIITSCLPRESIVEKLSEFTLITTNAPPGG